MIPGEASGGVADAGCGDDLAAYVPSEAVCAFAAAASSAFAFADGDGSAVAGVGAVGAGEAGVAVRSVAAIRELSVVPR